MSLTVNSGTDLSNLFSSLSSSNNSSSGSLLSSLPLADYASIKNGSYTKLAKAYYKKSDAAEDTDDAKETDTSKKTLANASTSLKSAATTLKDTKSLYEKQTIKDADGKETTDYDWDTLSKKVSNFVDGYNSTLSKLGSSTDSSYSSAYLTMVKKTSSVSGLLSKVGISMTEDGSLEFDSDEFKKSDMSTVKSLFSGSGSYADMIGSTASTVASKAATAGSTYGSTGSYSALSTSSVFDSYL